MPHHVLLVEDDEDQRNGLTELLTSDGYDVTGCASAEEALNRLEARAVDLLVADYQLHGATGSWLARVAGINAAAAPRVLLMTAHDQLADAEGFTVLRKPLDLDRFRAEVRNALARDAMPPTAAGRPEQRIALILYVSNSLASRKTAKALRTLLEQFDRAQIALTVVDVESDRSQQAEDHRVVVTPTLLRTFPAPKLWITGELKQLDAVQSLLEQAGVERRA